MTAKIKAILALVFWAITSPIFLQAQCSGETVNFTNRCLGQQPQVDITPVVSNVTYNWFDLIPKVPGPGNDTLKLGKSNSVTYPAPLGVGGETFYYQKEISAVGGPTALPGPLNTGTMAPVPSTGYPYDMSITSATDFRLNYVTISIHTYSCQPSDVYRVQVQVGAKFSQWHTFTCADMIATSNTAIKLVKVPVRESATQLGLTAAAGTTNIQIHSSAAAPIKAVDAYEWFNPASFVAAYTLNTAPSILTINYGAAAEANVNGSGARVPGLFDWDITTLCPVASVSVTPSAVGCCTPGNVNLPAITSSTGSNIVNVVPIAPAITLSTPLQSGFYYQWYKDGVPMGGIYQGTNVNSISITDVGKYTVRVAEGIAHINKVSCVKEDLEWIQKRILFAEADKTTICVGESIDLLAKGATGPVSWSPSANMVGANTATPVFTPPSPGSYPLTVTGEVPVGNQIINGDFEAGNVQVNPSPYYTYVNPAGANNTTPSYAIGFPARQALSIGVGSYTINNYVFWPGFQAWLPIQDHTTGAGKFLYTDASNANQPGTAKFLWSQDVVVQPNTTYEFAAWVTNFNAEGDASYVVPPGVSGITIAPASNPLPELQLYIADLPAFATTPVISAQVGVWQKISTTWNSGALSGTVKLKLAEIFTGSATGGHDFALDDISFGAPGTQTHNITITVNDCNTITATATACSGDSVTISAQTNGVFQYWRNTTSGPPSVVGIKDPNAIVTKVKSQSGVSTQFTATAKFVFGNSIPNGDFSQYKSGFATTYSEVTNPNGSGMNPGQFVVGALPNAVDNTNFVNKRDRTTGLFTPTYYVGDSRYDVARTIAYRVSVPVTNGVEYGFSGWFANIHKEFLKATPDTSNAAVYPNGAKTTRLDLYINNQFVKRILLPLDTTWQNYTALWTANTTGNVNLELRSVNIPFASLKSGFAMDDLKFGTTYSVTKSVNVNTAVCVTPVSWLSFTGWRTKGNVYLQWQTASEYNSSHFILERSQDGLDYSPAGAVPAAGNSNSILSYTFADEGSNYTYYRIKQVDIDQSYQYSNVIYINNNSADILLFPNPSSHDFTFSMEDVGLIQVGLFASNGAELFRQVWDTNYPVRFGQDLSPGVYILEITSEKDKRVVKLVKD